MTNKNILRFVKAPPLGVAIEHGGSVFEIVGVEPYTNRSGEESSIIRWRTECVVCSAAFEFTSGRSIRTLNRRCDEHKIRNPVARFQRSKQAGGFSGDQGKAD